MHPLSPLFGVAVLALVLTANYFRTAWKLGLLQAFGRRRPLTWRTIIAGSLAAFLPMAGAFIGMAILPAGETERLASGMGPGWMALELSVCGLGLHAVSDWLIGWGSPLSRA